MTRIMNAYLDKPMPNQARNIAFRNRLLGTPNSNTMHNAPHCRISF
jgi:hypothetical protein